LENFCEQKFSQILSKNFAKKGMGYISNAFFIFRVKKEREK